ncbi:MAG: hypothetical protein CMH52_10675 [Myxococcales bacterium]|nr:hypothetical protein [Myxococcales bacterium]|tara:strand:+ start:921 stop:1268 length:348 start_codon:yes stop_codon:yes gene_type:complete
MDRKLLSEMLFQTNDVDIRGWNCSVTEGSELTILLRSEAGPPSPLKRITGLTLFDGFAVFDSGGSRYVLPYDRVVGLQVTSKRDALQSRPKNTDAYLPNENRFTGKKRVGGARGD